MIETSFGSRGANQRDASAVGKTMRISRSMLALTFVTSLVACGQSNGAGETSQTLSAATLPAPGEPGPTGAATGGTACSPNTTTADPNAPANSNTVTADPNSGLYAFFEVGLEEGGSDIESGFSLVLTHDGNFCVPSSATPGFTVASVKQGSVSMSVQLPAPIKGNQNGTFLGVRDYPTATISIDTHSADPNGWPQTCALFGGGAVGTADLNIETFNTAKTSMDIALDANLTQPVHFQGTARACNLMTANPDANPGYGNATWIEGNFVNCTP